MVIREGRGSVSLLQRALGIGYGRAARLIDFMAEDGIVGAYNGSQAREVLVTIEQWQTMNGETAPAPEPPKPRRNKIMPDPFEDEESAPPPTGRARHSVIMNVEHADADDEIDDSDEEVEDGYDDEESDCCHEDYDDEAAEEDARDEDEVDEEEEISAERDEEAVDEDESEDESSEEEESENQETIEARVDKDDNDAHSPRPTVRRFKAESA